MRQTRKASASFLLLMAVPERRKRIPPLPDGEGKEEAGSFLNHKVNRVKPKISTMVFLGERKSILPGAEAAADKALHSTSIRPRKRRIKP